MDSGQVPCVGKNRIRNTSLLTAWMIRAIERAQPLTPAECLVAILLEAISLDVADDNRLNNDECYDEGDSASMKKNDEETNNAEGPSLASGNDGCFVKSTVRILQHCWNWSQQATALPAPFVIEQCTLMTCQPDIDRWVEDQHIIYVSIQDTRHLVTQNGTLIDKMLNRINNTMDLIVEKLDLPRKQTKAEKKDQTQGWDRLPDKTRKMFLNPDSKDSIDAPVTPCESLVGILKQQTSAQAFEYAKNKLIDSGCRASPSTGVIIAIYNGMVVASKPSLPEKLSIFAYPPSCRIMTS